MFALNTVHLQSQQTGAYRLRKNYVSVPAHWRRFAMRGFSVCAVLLNFIVVAAYGGSLIHQSDKSTATATPLGQSVELHTVNKSFRFDFGPISGDPLVDFPPITSQTQRLWLIETTQDDKRRPDQEKGPSFCEMKALDVRSKKPLWTLKDLADRCQIHSNYFLVTTVDEGCCGSDDSYRAYSELTADYLFSYNFRTQIDLPIVLRQDAFNPNGFRFLAYQDNYWPSRDKLTFSDGNLQLAGVLTYASPLKAIQKVAILLDSKAWGDPSQEPDDIRVMSKNKQWDFQSGQSGKKNATYEVEYWNDKTPPRTSKTAFSDLTITLTFDEDSISIPLKEDRLDLSQAQIKAKFYKKVVELPQALWKPKDLKVH